MLQTRTVAITALAILATLLLVAGGVAAHGDGTDGHDHDDAPVDGTAEEWAEWMEQHMADHMGEDAATQMREHMGMSYEEMGRMMEGMMNDDEGMMGDDEGMMGKDGSGMGCH